MKKILSIFLSFVFIAHGFSATPLWNGTDPKITFKSPRPFYVGVSGHPIYSSTPAGNYTVGNGITLAAQIATLQDLGANIYRIDHGTSVNETNFLSVVQSLVAANIKPLIVINSWDSNNAISTLTDSDADLTTAYNTGYTWGAYVAQHYGAYTDIYEAGNECDITCLAPGTDWRSGDLTTDYVLVKMKIAYKYLSGICEGVHSQQPSAKVIIDSGYYGHTGWFRFLENPSWLSPTLASWPKVNYDIVGWHPYVSNGGGVVYNASTSLNTPDKNILRALHSITEKDIFLTEYHRQGGTYNDGSPLAKDALDLWIMDMMFEAGQYVMGVIIYELYDDDVIANSNSSNSFGLLTITYDGSHYQEGVKKDCYYSAKKSFSFLLRTHTNP